jgi:hypothetical protein
VLFAARIGVQTKNSMQQNEKVTTQNRYGKDRFAQKLELYEGLRALPDNVSRANSAVIWIAAIITFGLDILADAKAPWYVYLILVLLSLKYCLFAVWREKNAKAKQNKFVRKSPA